MADQDTLYFELRDALTEGGCPLCRLGRRAATRTIEMLNYEGVNDPALRRKLAASHGLCHRHAWEWAAMRGSPLGIAIVYQNLIKNLIEVLSGPTGTSPKAPSGRAFREGTATSLGAGGRCPACHAEAEAERRHGLTLLAHLEESALADAYVRAGGLCLPHLRIVLALANPAQARTVQERQLAIYRALHEQLGEFIRKHDHRFRHEPFGEEKDAWRRAVAVLAGEPDVSG